MQDKKLRPDEQGATKPAPEATDEDAQAAADDIQSQTDDDPTEALRAENAELRDRLLRAVAEMENLRKRTEREVRDARQYAISSFARDILGVGDNLRRAFESVGDDARQHGDAVLKSLMDGIDMTERELLNTLERHGVAKVDPQGERFDPHLHQAMMEIEDASVPSGTVVQVLQIGYTINGRVLRPAMVAVSKGGPKPGPAPAADDSEAATEQPSAAGEAAPGPSVNRTA
jgi:molecular chaperone GrpE